MQSGYLCDFSRMEKEMKVVLDIKLEPKHLFRFNMNQTYKGMQGILSVILPIFIFAYAVMSIGKVDVIYTALYFVLGIVFLVYVPASLWKRSKTVVNDSNNALSKTVHYEFEEDAIKVSVEDESVEFKWENIYILRTSGDLILLFTNRINAYILPIDQVKDEYEALYQLAHEKLEKHRIKMYKPQSK